MIIRNPFDYQLLQRTENSNGRFYNTPDGKLLPSVTTILSATKDNSYLDEWRNNIGEQKAAKITEEASRLGTELHKNLERYILGNELCGSYMSKILANVMIKNGLSQLSEVWGTEVSLYTKDLYAGTTDLIGVFNNLSSILDFKNSLRLKKEEWIEDYFLQCCAYAISHNEMFGTNIKSGVIMVATRDAKYQEFIITGSKFEQYTEKWLKRLEKYYIMIDSARAK